MNVKRKRIVILAFVVLVVFLVAFGVNALLNQQSPDLAAYTAQAQKLYKDAYGFVEKTRGSLFQIFLL